MPALLGSMVFGLFRTPLRLPDLCTYLPLTLFMSESSDTESEHDSSSGGWEAADFMQMAADVGSIEECSPPGVSELQDALELLESLNICAVEHVCCNSFPDTATKYSKGRA